MASELEAMGAKCAWLGPLPIATLAVCRHLIPLIQSQSITPNWLNLCQDCVYAYFRSHCLGDITDCYEIV